MKPKQRKENHMQCPLCGHRFAPGEQKGCKACAFGKGCERICCPHCGYGFVERSKLLDWFGKWLNRKENDGGT